MAEHITRITHSGNGMLIIIEGPSSKFAAQDLTTAAIVALIQEADTHGWEKLEVEDGVNDPVTPADRFYNAVLSAVARHYAVDAMWPEDMAVHTALFEIISDLTNKGRLRNTIRAGTSSEGDRTDNEPWPGDS